MSGQVKWFSSDNLNAPKLTNTWGSMIDVLDECLINGFGTQALISLQIQDGVGIATFANPHKINQFQWIEISGADTPELNAEFKVLGITSNTLEFLIDLPDQTATGSIACKLASVGWVKKFSGTHKAVYQAKDLVANPYFLRVDNSLDPVYTTTYAKFAKVGILESCTGIDDIGGNQAPFDPTNSTKNWLGTGSGSSAISGWAKWYHATAINSNVGSTWSENSVAANGDRDWVLVATKDSFFILPSVAPNTSTNSNRHCSTAYGFGVFDGQDIPFLSAQIQYAAASTSRSYSGTNTTFCTSDFDGLILLKDVFGAYQPDTFTRINFTLAGGNFTGYSDSFSKKTGENIYHCPFLCVDKSNYLIGEPPLLRCVMNSTASTEPAYTLFTEDNRAYLKRRFFGSSLRYGSILIDLGEVY
ncbi:hypothetical protein [Acinetobacter sp. P8-3-8]|uniref:hypothetical protein n=1 Tax=Acinetobacter sp. P8-3-8 TaxID=1029823 RepID=UPI0002486959|nr:hypothetical protein [Acinetobacter sp. P8-3-8]